jgi:hypothetical protein
MSLSTRHARILGAVAVVSVAVVGLLSASEEVPKARVGDTRTNVPGSAARSEVVRLDLLKRAEQSAAGRDLFASTTPPPPPAPPPPPPPPQPKPTAPPLPFTSMGKLETAGEPTVYYLQEGDKVHTVVVGDMINAQYRVESVNNGVMEFTYLPLKSKQSLNVGGDS